MLPGDLVVIYFGARTPFILRMMIVGSVENPEYELMGDCYIQGLMYGEVGEDESHLPREFQSVESRYSSHE